MADPYWQCSRSLQECIRYMYTNVVNCDVTFRVGETGSDVQAHTFILISRSPVFYAMLSGPLATESDIITIPDVEEDIFKLFLTYMYTDEIQLDDETVMQVMYVARKYGVDGLANQCTAYLLDAISFENVCEFLDTADMFNDTVLRNNVSDFICKHSAEFLSTDCFLDLCPKCVQTVSSFDNLMVDEATLYEALLNWSDKECSRRSLEVNDKNRRQVLDGILKNIKFFMMTASFLEMNVLNRDIITQEEKEDLMRVPSKSPAPTITGTETKVQSNVCVSKRKCYQVLRFAETDLEECCFGGEQYAISLETSHDIYLHGIAIYGTDCYTSCFCDVIAEVIDSEKNSLAKEITSIETSVQTDLYEIYFKRPVMLSSGSRYTIALTVFDFETKSGVGGKKFLYYNDIKIRFYNSEISNHGTDIFRGQIPGLLLS